MIFRMKNKYNRERGLNRNGFLRIAWPFLLAAVIFLFVRIALLNAGSVEAYYSEGVYPIIARSFSGVSSLLPFSVWDLFWLLSGLLFLVILVMAILRKVSFGRYLLRLFQLLALIYAFFYLVWGFNYFRPKMETRLGWSQSRTDETAFRALLDTIIMNTNANYTSLTSSDYPALDSLIEESYFKNSKALKIIYPNGVRRPKTMLFSSFFAKSGVSGYFGPFFNEIHLNYYLLPMEYPYVLAHEKAHQFGITNESEANLTAFIICTTSDDKRLQYSGYVNLLLYFLSDASRLKDVNDYIKKIDKRVILDLRFQRSHWQGLRNKTLDKMQTKANDVYLKTNHVEGGVRNYNKVVSLAISWYQNRE